MHVVRNALLEEQARDAGQEPETGRETPEIVGEEHPREAL
jgi:hypothetical protein